MLIKIHNKLKGVVNFLVTSNNLFIFPQCLKLFAVA